VENKDKFIKELHDLLEKYNIEISVGIEGDTHGVTTWINIEHKPKPNIWEQILSLDELTAYDLKSVLNI